MTYQSINIQNKLALFSEHWSPKIIAQMNDYHFKGVKVQGEFVWHQHAETDEVFLVVEGQLEIHLRDGVAVLNAGELFVVPKGVGHKPVAEAECKILLIEPAGAVNTGDAGGERTALGEVCGFRLLSLHSQPHATNFNHLHPYSGLQGFAVSFGAPVFTF